MPVTYNYGGRIGMSSILAGIHFVCRIYGKSMGTINTFVDGSSLTSEQKTQVKDWLNAATAVCALVESIKVVYER